MTAQTTTGVQTLDMAQICTELLNRHSDMSWREIASKPEYRGIPAGTLWSIAKGREPKSLRYRTILHLPRAYSNPSLPEVRRRPHDQTLHGE
jgi:nucleoid-associated protein YgaU